MTREEFASAALSYLEEVTAYTHRLCRSPWDGDDLAQATFEQAFRKWEGLAKASQCRAWLFRIARNLHFDRVRQSAARPELRLVKSHDSLAREAVVPPETVERMGARVLENALLGLPEKQRESLLLCDLWGFRYEEIAEITDAAVGTVRSRISRARSHLSSSLLAAQNLDSKSGGQS